MSELLYKSTRGKQAGVTSARAILQGIAEDGGLFVPDVIPGLASDLTGWSDPGYRRLAGRIMRMFLTDYSDDSLREALDSAYDSKFDTMEIAPVRYKAGCYFLELFHGPTLAFKDLALAILPHLMLKAEQMLGQKKEIVILTATSGDTGKAALAGFADVAGTHIIVFYPEHGVSPVQKRQMVTEQGKNTHVIGIEGNFDDAQSKVKEMFTDKKLIADMAGMGYAFSSANSINIGRLIPQIVYYFHAYLQVVAQGGIRRGDQLNFAVPTGNFGNILAGYYAGKMGLPVGKLICASNKNKVLFDFFQTGVYDRNRDFYVTMSPSMDILISSNLERLLYHAAGEDGEITRILMERLSVGGHYHVPDAMRENLRDFWGGYADEEETAAAIRHLFGESGYLLDPHTAVAYAVLRKYRRQTSDLTPAVVVSTASPYKFPRDVLGSLDAKYYDRDDFALLSEMADLSGTEIPRAMKGLETKPAVHRSICSKDEMQNIVREIILRGGR